MFGEHLNNWNLWKLYRYALVITTVPRERSILQGSVDCDKNRTSVVFRRPDICKVVGDIWHRIINKVTRGTSLLRTKSNYCGVAFGLCRTKGE